MKLATKVMLCGAALCLEVQSPRPARAEAPSPKEGAPVGTPASTEQARQHFSRGVELYKEGSLDAALAEFEKAYEEKSDYRLLYNLGQVQSERQDYAAAIRYFRKYLQDGATEIAPDRRAAVEESLRSHLARVAEVWVTTNVASGELLVDGFVVERLPLTAAVQVNAGIRELNVRAGGRAGTPRRLTLVGGGTERLRIEVESAPPVATDEPIPAANTSHALPLKAWVAFGAAGLLAGSAVGFGWMASRSKSDFDGELASYPGDRQRIDDDRQKLRVWAGLTDGAAAAALVCVGLGSFFWLTSGSEDSRARAPETLPLTVGLTATGVSLAGGF